MTCIFDCRRTTSTSVRFFPKLSIPCSNAFDDDGLNNRRYGELGAHVVLNRGIILWCSRSCTLQGLIICRTQYLLHDPTIKNIQNQQSIASMVGHEVAHMWFVQFSLPSVKFEESDRVLGSATSRPWNGGTTCI